MNYGILASFLVAIPVYFLAVRFPEWQTALALLIPLVGVVVTWKVETRRLAGWSKHGYADKVQAPDCMRR